MSTLFHEALERSAETMRRMAELAVTVCGAGALGGNLAETLARSGFRRLRVIDRDRVEERNLSTQPWERGDVGARKARTLANGLYRALAVEIEALSQELTVANGVELLTGSGVVVDTLDNSAGRGAVQEACRALAIPCLHVGLAAGYAEVLWDEAYRLPSAAQDDVCDYPLARNLVLLAVAVAAEVLIGFAAAGEHRSYTLTLADLAIRPFAG